MYKNRKKIKQIKKTAAEIFIPLSFLVKNSKDVLELSFLQGFNILQNCYS